MKTKIEQAMLFDKAPRSWLRFERLSEEEKGMLLSLGAIPQELARTWPVMRKIEDEKRAILPKGKERRS